MGGGPSSTHSPECGETNAIAELSPCDPTESPIGVRRVGHEPYQIVAPRQGATRDCFPDLIPARPYCAEDPSQGVRIRKREEALRHEHIQYNGPNDIGWLIFDVDQPAAFFAADDANLPPPTVIVANPENGHAHLAYRLERPVLKFAESRQSPLRYAAAVERGFVRRLDADRHYSGLIAKNPMHPKWRVEWLTPALYDLTTLADWLFEPDTRPYPHTQGQSGFGRNCQLFDDLRAIAYREVLTFKGQSRSCAAFATRLEDLAVAINRQFADPLGRSEVRSVARSVAKWTWRRFSAGQFSEIQASRGRRTRRSTGARMAVVDALADDGP